MEYEIKPKTWTCPNGHINSLSNKECPLCKEDKFKEIVRERNLISKKKYNYTKNENIK